MADRAKREQWKEWLDEFEKESDRSCALLGAAFLDEQIRGLLEAFFVDDPKRVGELFEGSGPVATLSSRIEVAYALGFITPTELRDLGLIRKIRNQFAHELHGLSFETESISARCNELTAYGLVAQMTVKTPRMRFVTTVVLVANWVATRRMAIKDGRRKVRPEVDGKNVRPSDLGA
jgi:mannitol operon repressor